MQRYRIFVVEDDAAIRKGLCDALRVSGYDVLVAKDVPEAQKLIHAEEFDLALLDVVLPGGTGFELLKEIRTERSVTPVMMLTARGSEDDKVYGLKSGADDYVVKPFSIVELLARIEAVLRRSPERPRAVERVLLPNGYLDFKLRELVVGENRVVLTTREFELARHLAMNAGRIISREEILSRVWKMDPRMVETRTTDVTMARLREKMGTENAGMIKTLRGQGYVWGDVL
ncbi:MAG: response regulator transcription factor [Akkermansia sp.]|nr:response regulator transcription factor [Akkermansia sp.]